MKELLVFLNNNLVLMMSVTFGVFFVAKALIHYTVKAEQKYMVELDKRITTFVKDDSAKGEGFTELLDTIMKKTEHDLFEMRARNLRRKADRTLSFLDRIFMVRFGVQQLIDDTINHSKLYKDESESKPDFTRASFTILKLNQIFNNLIGLFSIDLLNRVMGTLPGLFIIFGIFGTFLGITNGLPLLGEINPSQIKQTKTVLDSFLSNVAFSMNSSLVGIIFSTLATITNSLFSYNASRQKTHIIFSSCLDFLWNASHKKSSKKVEIPNDDNVVSLPSLPVEDSEAI